MSSAAWANGGATFEPKEEKQPEPERPSLHDRLVILVGGHKCLDLCPLIGIEGAEGIFRGERDMVFAVGHHPKSKIF